MLDLDHIAGEKARSLKQKEDLWRKVVWSPEFQKFTTSLSDGEIENIVAWCPSVDHLKSLIHFLSSKSEENSETPFSVLLEVAKKTKMSPEKWIVEKLPLDGKK